MTLDKKRLLYDIVSDLKKQGYQSKLGPLEQSVAFIELEAKAESEMIKVFQIMRGDDLMVFRNQDQVFDYLEDHVPVDRNYLKNSYTNLRGSVYIIKESQMRVKEYLNYANHSSK